MNAIYKVIFNRATGQPVVVSELGKGKIKSSTSKSIKTAVMLMAAAISMPSFATNCDPTTLICKLNSSWSVINNYQKGTAFISDGNSWAVSGVDLWSGAGKSYNLYNNLDEVINAGYSVTSSGAIIQPGGLITTNFSLSTAGQKSVSVFDPITQAYTSIKVYDSNSFSEKNAYDFGVATPFMVPNVNVYVDTRLVDVSNGHAEISLNNDTYAIGELRNSHLINIDGQNNTASATLTSKNKFLMNQALEWLQEGSSTAFTAKINSYKGNVQAFDGSNHTVNNLGDFKKYNDWLVKQVQLGNLEYKDYDSELKNAYNEKEENYIYSIYPNGSSYNAYGDAEGSIIHASGANALAKISSTGELFVSSGSANTMKVFQAENNATIINDGIVIGSGRLVDITSGASFINNGTLSLGGTSGTKVIARGLSAFPVYVTDAGSSFINHGDYNIDARALYENKSSNATTNGVTLLNGAQAINYGNINSGYWGNTTLPDEQSGSIRSILVRDDSTFLNDTNGHIQLGTGEDGLTHDYLGSGSIAVEVRDKGKAINAGTITLRSTADGVIGLYATGNAITLINSGLIEVNSDGNGGKYIPAQIVGLYSEGRAGGRCYR